MDKQTKTKELILSTIEEKMLNNLTDISIDAMCKELHISKRTIYELFYSKEEIFETIAKRMYHKMELFTCSTLDKIRQKEISFTDGILDIMQFMSDYHYVHKHFHKVLKNDIDEKQKHKSFFLNEIYSLAVECDVIRKNVNKDLFAMLVDLSVKAMLTPMTRIEYNIPKNCTLGDLHYILINGILTENGRNIAAKLNDEGKNMCDKIIDKDKMIVK